jgi:hypothetical protein
MRLKRSVIGAAGALVLALAAGGAAAATPPKPPPPPEAIRLINDAALTVRARRQVNADKELQSLNLGVRVTKGVAHVWGPMPDGDVPRRVQAKLLQLEGITEVQCRLYADSPRTKAATQALAAGPPSRPVCVVQTAKPLGPPDRFPTLTRKEVSPKPTERSARRTEGGLVSRPAVTTPAAPATARDAAGGALREAILKVQQSQPAFRDAQVTLSGGKVLVKPAPGEAASATELAEKLRDVPNIGPVVLLSE